jgi:hypothetical protein
MLPEAIHRIQIRRGPGEEADLDSKVVSQIHAVLRGMRTTSVFEQYDMPATPCGPYLFEKVHMRLTIPLPTDEEIHVAALDIDHAV